MAVTTTALRQLHSIHRQLTDIRENLQRGPMKLQAAETNVLNLQQEVAAFRERLKRTRVRCDEKNLHLNEREGRIQDLKRKLNRCSTNREYQTLLEQIAADEQANSVLSDEILESLERIDREEQHVADAEAKHHKATDELGELRQRIEQKRQSLEADLAQIQADLSKAEDDLPADFRADYHRIVQARGEDAMAPADGQSCGGCYQTTTPQMHDQLLCDKPVFCKSCGRLLYLAEDTSVTG